MGLAALLVGIVVAALIASGIPQVDSRLRPVLALLALLAIFAGAALSTVRYVGSNEVGIVRKNALGERLTEGRIIATDGEMGIQAETLPPGWHLWFWPVIYDVSTEPLIEVPPNSVGLVEARDGQPLEPGQLYAPEVPPAEFKKMIDDAAYFLSEGNGKKGPQVNVLTPGKYRVNTELFAVEIVPALEVEQATVAVLKANFGERPSVEREVGEGDEPVRLAAPGEKGVLAEPLRPGKYPVNTLAFTVTEVSTRETIVRFTSGQGAVNQSQMTTSSIAEEREITVRTSDGFTFPVDVRIEFKIEPDNAPVVVAKLGDDDNRLLSKMNSTVRAVFRNNAESVKALDYVSQRSEQERQSLDMISSEMARVGVTVTGVRIGDVGNEDTLGDLLKTQRDREIAVQEQITFQEQQRAAEQKKALTRTEQEAEEERRLATAQYEVQIAEQEKQRAIIGAEAEAEAIRIAAEAQADAYQQIANQIGASNAALMELMKIVGERGINITPRVMVVGSNGQNGGSASPSSANSSETTALIGTMLDTMINRDEQLESEGAEQRSAPSSRRPRTN